MQENVLLHSELEIGEFTSPNANHIRGNYESLWPTDLQFFFVSLRIYIGRMRITFANGFAKRPFSLVLIPF